MIPEPTRRAAYREYMSGAPGTSALKVARKYGISLRAMRRIIAEYRYGRHDADRSHTGEDTHGSHHQKSREPAADPGAHVHVPIM